MPIASWTYVECPLLTPVVVAPQAADNVNQVRIRYLLRLKMGEEESDEENGDDY